MTSARTKPRYDFTAASRRWLLAPLLIAAALLSACAVAPLQEMSDARQALQSAREIGADKYAPQQLNAAATGLTDAERLLGEGKDQYSLARTKALASKESAIVAREIAIALSRAQQSLTQASATGLDTTHWQATFDAAVADAASGRGEDALKKAQFLAETIDAAIAGAQAP